MKKIKNLKLITVFTLLFSVFISNVFAASATVGFGGDSTVVVGDNITVTMYVSNVTDTTGGVVSVGGNLSFDSEYLEYVSSTGTSSPYLFQINTSANYKIAGLDTSLSNGINSQTTVFTFVFKAKKAGTTTVTLNNAKLSDTSSKITAVVNSKTITITEEENKSGDATLKSLSVEGATLSPSFSPNTTSYTVTVPSDTNSVRVIGSVNDSNATVTGLGDITLTGDTTTATIKVKAEDGTIKTYTIKINKEVSDEPDTPVVPDEPVVDPDEPVVDPDAKDNDATLKSLDVSGFTLTPVFDKDTKTYSINVANNITALNVEAIPNSDKATVSVSGNTGWREGVNTVLIKVTAEDGSTNIYVVNVTREASTINPVTPVLSSDNYLSDLIINSSHEINTSFNKNTSNYNVTVPYDVTSLDLKTILSDSKANVTVSGNSNFKVGVNTVEITVTAEDGSARIYTLNVTRTTSSSETDLDNIVIKEGTLSPSFNPNVLEYTTKVDSSVDKLTITANPKNKDSKVEIIGNENLKEGSNTILIKVTDKNGFSKYYQIEVEKEAGKNTILGLTKTQFGVIASIIGILLLLLLLLLLRRKKDKKEENRTMNSAPVIEVKPEFNFGSKNSSDDDVVHGNFNQSSEVEEEIIEPKKLPEAKFEEVYDLYDETVTKQELIDAIREATETKDPSKLKMLLDQEALNQLKKELKEKEENNRR